MLLTHPAVAEAVAFGFPHPTWGEEVAAAVVLRSPEKNPAILAYCREQLADFKCPKKLYIVEKIPRTATGKIQRGAWQLHLRVRRSEISDCGRRGDRRLSRRVHVGSVRTLRFSRADHTFGRCKHGVRVLSAEGGFEARPNIGTLEDETIAESELLGGASPRVAPFVDLRTLGSLAQRAGLALPVVDLDRAIVRYSDILALMRDLRAAGATNALVARSRTPLRRDVLSRAGQVYAERFADTDGRLRATFDILWLSGWVAHESQPKPLKPGSAAMRLADALKAGTSSTKLNSSSARKRAADPKWNRPAALNVTRPGAGTPPPLDEARASPAGSGGISGGF